MIRVKLWSNRARICSAHIKANHETKNELKVALDPFDSIGIIDKYFPNADFFTTIERFDRYYTKK